MNRKIAPFVENVAEATTACLVTMVQGNILAVTLGHWLIASQTGIVAGTIATGILLVWRTIHPRTIAMTLGLATAIVDYFVHPGQFGPLVMEAIVTGLGAAAMSYVVSLAAKRMRARRRDVPATSEPAVRGRR